MIISEILINYNFENKNYNEAKLYHFKILNIKDSIIADNIEMMGDLNKILTQTIIKNINQKHQSKIQL